MPSVQPTLPFNRLLNLASVMLLAFLIFGMARLGFGVVPVWILAVPFVLLASLDLEGCFSQPRTFTSRLMVIAFHFVIVATVVAAHQQIGAGGGASPRGDLAASSPAWGCSAGGCGASSGAGGKSACGCGSGSNKTSGTSASGSSCGCGSGKSTATPSPAKPLDKRPVYPTGANRSQAKATTTVSVPFRAPTGNPPPLAATPIGAANVLPIPPRIIPQPVAADSPKSGMTASGPPLPIAKETMATPTAVPAPTLGTAQK